MADDSTMEEARPAAAAERNVRFGLSGKLLVLTVLFVMVAEVLIYVPAIANFRLNWLNDRLAAAHTAALVLDAAPSGMVPESLARQILDHLHFVADTYGLVIHEEQEKRAISGITAILTLWAAGEFGVSSVYARRSPRSRG